MSNKEYEMYDDYKEALSFLVERIAERDEFAEKLKLMPPEKRPEGLHILEQLTKAIEEGEQSLAIEYENYQKLRRLEAQRDEIFDKLTEGLAGAYVHAKYRNPDLIPQLNSVIENMEENQTAMFRRAIARHESGDLIRIIAREGETREQTEEFLKNFRAAEESKEKDL